MCIIIIIIIIIMTKTFGTNPDQQLESTTSSLTLVGYNQFVTNDFEPVCRSGNWETPQPGSATTLRVKAGNTNDTAAGSGARTVAISGLNAFGEEVSETLTCAGTSASAVSANTYVRLLTFEVATSGTYAVPTSRTGSNAANMYIENGAGGTNWAQLMYDEMGMGKGEIGCYTVPVNKTAYINDIFVHISSDATPKADILVLTRANILETAAPYTPMRLIAKLFGATESVNIPLTDPYGPIPGLTDIVVMARATTGTVAVTSKMSLTLNSV